ncbi:MAG: hypothetical protein AABW73_01140 [Nanoarchaeota archaeon]
MNLHENIGDAELVTKIKLKGTLKALPDFYVNKEVAEFKKKHPKAGPMEVFKAVRKKLHESYGAYQNRKKRRRTLYLEELKLAREENWGKEKNSPEMKEVRRRMIRTSVSATERLEADYNSIYEPMHKELGKFKTLMDLGCGINPVSFCPSDYKEVKIYAYDIDSGDIEFLNKYFKIMGMNGEANVLDLHDLEAVDKLPKVDVCLLFKIIDPLERRGHEFSEQLIKRLKAKQIVVSFATKTITRKSMNHPNRGWFEQMIKRLGKTYKTIKTNNEIYYVVKN